MPTFTKRLQHAWNAFTSTRDPTAHSANWMGYGSTLRPDRVRATRGHERSIITSFYNKYKKKTVVVIPPLYRQRQWNKFKEYHLSYFLTELGKRNIPFCETLNAGMLKKQGKYVIVFSVATTKELLETVLHDYLTVGDYNNNGFLSLSFFYGEHHHCLKNVYPVG